MESDPNEAQDHQEWVEIILNCVFLWFIITFLFCFHFLIDKIESIKLFSRAAGNVQPNSCNAGGWRVAVDAVWRPE